jgi:hypothetical protein
MPSSPTIIIDGGTELSDAMLDALADLLLSIESQPASATPEATGDITTGNQE